MTQGGVRQHQIAQRLFLFVSSLWVGSLITVGYLVAPTLFATLTDRQVAGMVAGAIFQVEAYVSLVLCVALLVLANLLVSRGLQAYRAIRWILLAMLVCAALGSFVLMPWMDKLREDALLQGMPVMYSASASLFATLHGISSSVFLVQSLLGLYLVWRLTQSRFFGAR
ncbi:MAG: DUF4149 domain-containing protein [Burkholderiaceae bacterium]|nr:DUF4149 domain-containing protein [Burkholderiaceae bacterium]